MGVFTKSKSWKSMRTVDEKQKINLLWPYHDLLRKQLKSSRLPVRLRVTRVSSRLTYLLTMPKRDTFVQ